MHRLFLGCNLWAALFLAAAAVTGWRGSSHHVRLAIFAAVFACLVQSGVIALFLGVAKLIKEHVGRFGMPLTLIDRLNEAYHRLVPAAAVITVWMAAAAIAGGLADLGRAPVWLHHLLAVSAAVAFVSLIPFQYGIHGRIHRLLYEVERLLPAVDDPQAAPAPPGYRPDRIIMDRTGRGRAMLYIGLTLPLPYLGYTFIVGRDVSFLLIPTITLTAATLAGAAHQYRAARRHDDRR